MVDCIRDNTDYPVETPGHTDANLMQQPASGRRPTAVLPSNPRMRMYMMRWRMMNIYFNKNLRLKAEVVQEHRLEEAS